MQKLNSNETLKPSLMYYATTVIESPAYERITRLPFKYNISCGIMLADNMLYIIMVQYI